MPGIKEKSGQPTWVDEGLPDLRSLDAKLRTTAPDELAPAADEEAAIALLAQHFAVAEIGPDAVVGTPYAPVNVRYGDLKHIAEKRPDARERYVLHALDTMRDPFEIWEVSYDDGSSRLAFISAYASPKQLLVVVNIHAGHVLWNFMHCNAKALNRHRHGKKVYGRPPPLADE